MTISSNEHDFVEAELHEVNTARAELSFYNEDEEGKLNVKLSRRSWIILMTAIGYIEENK